MNYPEVMRIAVLGRGGSGKTTLAKQLGLPHIELDKLLWDADLNPQPIEWAKITAGHQWVIDGDLGVYDELLPRVHCADLVVVLDFPLWRCTWRTLRRGRENWEFWWWVLRYRSHHLPKILTQIPQNKLHLLRSPADVAAFIRAYGANN